MRWMKAIGFLSWTGRMTWISLTLCLLALWPPTPQVSSQESPHEQSISTRLVAPWTPTSQLHEAAEFLGDLNPALYWTFLEAVGEKGAQLPPPKGPQGERDLALVLAYPLVSASKLRMLDWALTARTESPRVLSLQELAPMDRIPAFCLESEVFVVVGHKISCEASQVEDLLMGEPEGLGEPPVVADHDHKYPSLVWIRHTTEPGSVKVAVLYGNLKSSKTLELHNLLKKWSSKVAYVFRPFEKKRTEEKMLLAGYGVELQFKSTEYKAQDDSSSSDAAGRELAGFNFAKLQELYPDKSVELDKLQNHLASTSRKSEFEALKAWQVQELGLQASYFVSEKKDLLTALKDVSGNFPSRASTLSSLRLPAEFKKSVSFNQRLLGSHFNLDEGEGAFFLQGSYVDPDALDLFTFMKNVQSELEFMELVRSLRQTGEPIKREEIERILAMGTKSGAEPEIAFDLRDSSVYWLNDLEKDEEYEDWPDDLSQLFFRMGGIMLRPVKRNVFNLVISVDPEDPNGGALLKMAYSFMVHKSPVRIGVVFCSPNPDKDAPSFIRKLMNFAVSEGKVREVIGDVVNALNGDGMTRLQKKWGSLATEDFDFGAELACEFVQKSGRASPSSFLNGIPLKYDSLDDFEDVVLNQLIREAQNVQVEAYNRIVDDDTNIFEHLMNKPHVLSRLNDKILDTSNSRIISFGTESWADIGKEFRDPLAKIATSLTYLLPEGRKIVPVTVTLWLFGDLETKDGREFLQNAVQFMEDSATHTRIAFISSADKLSKLTREVMKALSQSDLKTLKNLLKVEQYADQSGEEDPENKVGKEFLRQLGLSSGDRGLIVNGRLVGPLGPSDSFELGDFALIQKFSYDSCPKQLDPDSWSADAVMRLCAALGSPNIKKASKRFTLPEWQSPLVVSKDNKEEDVFYVDLTAVIDPASRHAHKMAALISAVEEKVGPWVRSRIVWNPPSKHSELPLKSYYRYVAGTIPDETVTFNDLPRDPLFTQNIFAPDNWMVEVVKCEKDLDNIRLKDLQGENVDSVYMLEYLLVEGHCLESKSGSPPRGLQFNLTPHNPSVTAAETIVMANLGYFQLKAAPGLWSLALREGSSEEIFSLENLKQKQVSVNSFQSIVLKVKVRRNPGKETASLLESEQGENGKDSSWFGFGSGKKENAQEDDTINVFSVASGHLYERLLRIMMLSVIKNTQSKVKFWFLKNYLSPTLKDMLPEMAKEYGFEYELVQYHWPRWLNPQREKQRIIWGYKILFLDVLFPLSLKKIVFVDADQVVRTDLKELFDLDLDGNPYGYTPFCESRTEMDGFRFWKQGYWKSHLGRRKYHISALYVVDLLKFRRIAAGDRLRGQYQALSQDPNSLSNLDQDLPNNMIHQVGIKSLPQEWLWCETWCDDASKSKAKTIDLCNNPQTKEPKLDAAQRIVPEWKDYDQEIRQFMQRLKEKKSQRSSDVDRADEHIEL